MGPVNGAAVRGYRTSQSILIGRQRAQGRGLCLCNKGSDGVRHSRKREQRARGSRGRGMACLKERDGKRKYGMVVCIKRRGSSDTRLGACPNENKNCAPRCYAHPKLIHGALHSSVKRPSLAVNNECTRRSSRCDASVQAQSTKDRRSTEYAKFARSFGNCSESGASIDALSLDRARGTGVVGPYLHLRHDEHILRI